MGQQRHPAGTPSGGRFAPDAHAESDVALAPVDPFTAAMDREAAQRRERAQERLDAMAADFRRQGAEVTSVAKIRNGYVVTAPERADALTAGQIALGAFAGDPEAGMADFTLERAGDEGWSMAVETTGSDSAGLTVEQRTARTAALQSVWEQLEDAKTMGWVDEVEVRCERPDPDTFVTSTKGVLSGHVRRRTWTAGSDGPTEVADFPATTKVGR